MTPVRWGVLTLVVNVVLSLVLKDWLEVTCHQGTLGLALSNALSTVVFAAGLNWELKRKVGLIAKSHSPILKILCAGALMGVVVVPLVHFLPHGKMGSALAVVIGAPVGLAIYALGLWVMTRETLLSLKRLAWK